MQKFLQKSTPVAVATIICACAWLAGLSLAIEEKYIHSPHDQMEFCYHPDPICGPAAWPGQCNKGALQSPINFDEMDTDFKILHPPLFRRFYTTGSDTQEFMVKNTGHSVEVFYPPGREPVLKGVTLDLPRNYRFFMMHFHWGENDGVGSEHHVFGSSYAMELHLVHYSTNYANYTEAAHAPKDPHAVAVISILYQVDPFDNLNLKPIVAALPAIRRYQEGNKVRMHGYLNLRDIFPQSLSFYRYDGSQTTPECVENQVWTVFRTPNRISARQVRQFRKILNGENSERVTRNHRDLQDRNGRPITLYLIPHSLFDGLTQLWIHSGLFIRQLFTKPFMLISTLLAELTKPIFVHEITPGK